MIDFLAKKEVRIYNTKTLIIGSITNKGVVTKIFSTTDFEIDFDEYYNTQKHCIYNQPPCNGVK
jgi:hypothetical protein